MSAGHFIVPEDVLRMPDDACGPLDALDAAEPPLLPYQPYSKNDRLGRVCDWNRPQKFMDFVYGRSSQGDAVQMFAFTYKEEEEDDSFRAVGRTAASIAAAQKKRTSSYTYSTRSRRSGFQSYSTNSFRGGRGGGRGGFRRFFTRNWSDNSRMIADITITVQPSWEKKQTFVFTSLSKSLFGVPANAVAKARELHERDLPPLPKPSDMEICGQLRMLNPASYQMASCKKPTPVKKSTKLSFSVTTSEDPVIARIAEKIREEKTDKVTIFATDNIVAALMTAPRSVLPWGVSIVRKGNFIYLDVSDNSMVDLVSVCETDGGSGMSQEADNVNGPSRLWQEATYISDMYVQHVLNTASETPAVQFEKPCPFLTEEDKAEGKEAAPVAYRYRRYSLNEGVDLVVRCELQGVTAPCTPETIDGNIVEICTLNEWNIASTAWKKELDQRRGVVLATEIKNNSCRMARVIAKAFLAGASNIHIGFITRKTASDTVNHVLLTAIPFATNVAAPQINVSERVLWGVADNIFQQIVPLPEGKYFLTKQDANPMLTLYSTPDEE